MAATIANKILDGSLQLFPRHGYLHTTIRDIAKIANVTEGSVFRMFGSKQALLAQAIRCKIIGSSDPAHPPLPAQNSGGSFDLHAVESAVRREIENILSIHF